MKQRFGKFLPLWAIALAGLGATQSVLATEKPATTDELAELLEILEPEDRQPAASVTEWLAQIEATQIQVTGIQINPTEQGLSIVLETTADDLAIPAATTEGNRLTAIIPNAVLALPGGPEYQQDNPVEGISQVSVIPLSGDQVQVEIVGIEGPPTVTIQSEISGLVFAVDAVSPVASEEEELELTVTAERGPEGYAVPEVSPTTRTDTPILDTPTSIQVVPKQVLEDQQVTRIDEALRNVSGVTFGDTFGGVSIDFNVRGFDAPTLRDGFREFGGFTGANPALGNVERVEVLKGPASILYGELQPGGIINIVTEQPLDQPAYEIGLELGNRGFVQPQIDLTGPLTPKKDLLYRLNVSYSRDSDFIDSDVDIERFLVAPVLSWRISDRTNLTLKAEYATDSQPFDIGLPAIGNGVADVPFSSIIVEPENFVNSTLFRVGYSFEHQFNDRWEIRNAFEYSRRDLLNTAVLPLAFDEATGLVMRFPGSADIDATNFSLQTSVVGAFATGPIDHKLLVGVDLNRTDEQNLSRFDFASPSFLDIFNPVFGLAPIDSGSLPISFNEKVQTNRLGLFLQDQIKVLDNLILVAGVRYDTVDQNITNGPTASDPVGSEADQNDDAVTPRFGIVYQPLEFLSLFASYSQSFTPNTETTSSGELLPPERGEGFEVGVKAALLNERLFATLSYFDISRRNVATPDPLDPFSSVATGAQNSRGVELDVTGEILPGWNVIASYAYTDAEVSADNTIPEGNRLVNIPEHSGSVWSTYEIQSGDLQGLGFGLGFNFLGEREGDLANSFELDSYFLANAAMFYRRDNWRLALNFKNIFDVDYIVGSNNSRTFGSEVGEPFTVIGSVTVNF
ncbi:Ferrichrome-iron receptor [Acaryochloris thomasi RCC1774]|uniref:Ferrichrome-iron receptor n=1 Tax=Acaryochloris thomasi RCC1774 TaxID=1764569 RepID=A0A2W1JV06_9CYAN|nr:TonB-dependent siderophore receptor [Acaryochloris thomasi]PZD72621.1 Ferrichrome-iron receptor [Acaryochloris thomasi RCC1774]